MVAGTVQSREAATNTAIFPPWAQFAVAAGSACSDAPERVGRVQAVYGEQPARHGA